MSGVDVYKRVRLACHHEGLSGHEAARRFGIDRRTVAKILSSSDPSGYQRTALIRRPKLAPFIAIIDRILKDDSERPRTQRHTAKRILERLRDEHGFTGGITIVRDYVRLQKQRSREMFVPLAHPAGHAQVDFGEALGVIGGLERKSHFFAMDLAHSDAIFVKGYPVETTEAFLDGHVAAFEFFGGVPLSIVCDNTKIAVARIPRWRQAPTHGDILQPAFSLSVSRSLWSPGKGNDEGQVEDLVGFARRNVMVPFPQFESFAVLNALLAEQCRKRQGDQLWGHDTTIAERLSANQNGLLDLPPVPFDACHKQPGQVSSLSLVRYRGNDCSVPVACGHRNVLVRGPSMRVSSPAAHKRSPVIRAPRKKADLVFDPLYYLPLLEKKVGALEQAAPLVGWDLPECFLTLHRLLEARLGKPSKREDVQVLRLLETFELHIVEQAIKQALSMGAIGYDAVKHLVLCQIERRPPCLDLDLYPSLPKANVETTKAGSYMSLLQGAQA